MAFQISAAALNLREFLLHRFCAVLVFLFCSGALVSGAAVEGAEFFESRIRPLLVESCYECHSAESKKLKGGLRLDSRAGWETGGDTGPAIVPGKPDASLLLKAVRWEDADMQMPPKRRLTAAQVADLAEWIRLGAPDPLTNAAPVPKPAMDMAAAAKFLAFQPLAAFAAPAVKNAAWAKTDLDRFVLAKLETAKLAPAPPADRRTLLRRLSYDLTGLPPTPEETVDFLRDEKPGAVARLVARLLASPHFGAHWGRHWLDVARFRTDDASLRASLGAYRRWVIQAVTDDLPYDRFIVEQIAGDLRQAAGEPGSTAIATAALALGPGYGRTQERVTPEQYAVAIEEQVEFVGKAVLGLTLQCARCHDHKFDPFTQADYYALAGVFQSTHYRKTPVLATVEEHRRFAANKARLDALEKERKEAEKAVGPALKLQETRTELAAARARTDVGEKEKRKHAESIARLEKREMELLGEQAAKGWTNNEPAFAVLQKLRAEDKQLEDEQRRVEMAAAVGDKETKEIRDAHLLIRGNPDQKGPVVPRGFPALLAGGRGASVGALPDRSGRLELARWLTGDAQALAARVHANRVWGHLFGRGLVRTPDNFGALGARPTHSELLDHLAARLVASGWSTKQLIRDIVLSSAYQQASAPSAAAREADADNEWFSRQNRKRLSAESFQDTLLAATQGIARDGGAEELKAAVAGRAVFGRFGANPDKRPPGVGDYFDAADSKRLVAQRDETIVAPQGLFLMNSDAMKGVADALAKRATGGGTAPDAAVVRAYDLLLGRPPDAEEQRLAREHIAAAGWPDYAQALLCLSELIYLD